ncbi:protein takeout [Stomoxys calcitrans]|uniref:Hemolymph juvenile hormone binding protein n=1 Tax=Stomoxys calcitrans TaxID=35570 RepID=A0A1I8Q6R6_STOCA|nr:protein takeout [Stomoxys calcitrans]
MNTKYLAVFFTIVIICTILLPVYSGMLPADFTKCKVGDNACVRDKMQELYEKFPKGNPSLALPDISALYMENITVARANSGSPLQLDFKFLDLINYGIETAKVINTTGWIKDPSIIEVDAEIPLLKLVGHYQVKGKILLFNLKGEGKATFELTDCKIHLKGRVKLEKRSNGKNYLKPIKLIATLEPKEVVVQMENLINGNKELSDSVNAIINENWRDIWEELRDGTNNVISQLYFTIIGNVLNVLSYDDFFAK